MGPREYKELIQSFLEEKLTIDEFETRYLQVFKTDPGLEMDKPLFDILENFFEDLDAYSPIWTSNDETPFRITGDSLRREAEEALRGLDQYLLEHPEIE